MVSSTGLVGYWKLDEIDQEVSPIVIADDTQTAFFSVADEGGGGSIGSTLSDDSVDKMTGVDCLLITVGAGIKLHAEVNHTYPSNQDFSAYNIVRFQFKGSNSGRTCRLRFPCPNWTNYFVYTFTDNIVGWRQFIIPMSQFTIAAGAPSWTTVKQSNFIIESAANGETYRLDRIVFTTGVPALDSSYNGNNSTSVVGTTVVAGKYGNARNFNGIATGGDYINLGNNTKLKFSTNNFTLSAWVKISTAGSYYIYRWRTSGIALLAGTSATVWFYNSTPTQRAVTSSGITVNDNNWHHIAGTYDGTTLIIYVDGISRGTNVITDTISYGSGGAAIGRDGNADDSYFPGIIDEVRIYNRALTAAEVSELYNGSPIRATAYTNPYSGSEIGRAHV
jgi:hypothetical protein